MSGIVGIINLNGQGVDGGLLKKMTNVIVHRGPDDEGFVFISTKSNSFSNRLTHDSITDLAFGHRRLSVIDLSSAGHQPMCNEDQTIWITYNGEIYNFREIRSTLEDRGHKFKSNTDTEVIIHAYEEYGIECVKKFNGMFAFGLWDGIKKRLFLVRDRLGIKPIYYYKDNDKLIFSSEIKAIIQDERIERKLNEFALHDFIVFQNILDDKTFFKNVFKLRAGHYLTLENEKIKIEQYWEIDFTKTNLDSVLEYLERYKKIFGDSVKRHLISDIPVGSYLSGGFDSTSVATLASEIISEGISTFTGAFDEGVKYDERKCAREVAQRIKSNHHEVVITPKDFLDNIEKVIYHLDEPCVGSGSLSQFVVSRLVSKHVKVVLTGHGGDEFFCGYPAYKTTYYVELIKRNLFNIFRILPGFKPEELARMMYFFIYPIFVPELRFGLYIMFPEKERRRLLAESFLSEVRDYNPVNTLKNLIGDKGFSDSDQVLYLYAKVYLPALFIQEDKVCMANSVEARVPICDNELVSFSTSIPMEYKLFNNTVKYLPKEAMKDKLPPSLYAQPKRGFPTPISKWFRSELKEFLYDVLTGERIKNRNIFNCNYLKKLLDTHCHGFSDTLFDYNNATRIYSILTVELWHRVFIDK